MNARCWKGCVVEVGVCCLGPVGTVVIGGPVFHGGHWNATRICSRIGGIGRVSTGWNAGAVRPLTWCVRCHSSTLDRLIIIKWKWNRHRRWLPGQGAAAAFACAQLDTCCVRTSELHHIKIGQLQYISFRTRLNVLYFPTFASNIGVKLY